MSSSAFQLLVLGWFAVAAFSHVANGTAFDATAITPDWFNPFAVGSFSAFAAGVSLSIFVYWGWDVTLTMNEETKNPEKTPGRAATVTVLVIVLVYMTVSLATLSFAGIGETGLGAGNPENQGSIFAVLAGPVMGPFAILMSLAILSSSAASLQSTFVSPARTLLSMGHYRALPVKFGRVSPSYKSPSYATVASAVAAAAFYVITRTTSENALWDTITALGMMICFYYGITALACVWFFRAEAFSGARAFFFKFLAPLLGGVILLVMFFKTAYDSMDPAYGSGIVHRRRRPGLHPGHGRDPAGRGPHAGHGQAPAGILQGRDPDPGRLRRRAQRRSSSDASWKVSTLTNKLSEGDRPPLNENEVTACRTQRASAK